MDNIDTSDQVGAVVDQPNSSAISAPQPFQGVTAAGGQTTLPSGPSAVSGNQAQPAQFGTIQQVEARKVWPNEEKNFTPWLADNISQLADALGFAITIEKTEQRVGSFELDIYAKDDNDNAVVIENQIEATDHLHLGQLLTYASGLGAKKVVWVVPRVRDEHRTAMEWLNNITTVDVSFFLVRFSVITIGNSPYAVQFFVEAKPSTFQRALNRVKTQSVSPDNIVWSDDAGTQVPVASWSRLYQLSLKKALDAGIDILTIPSTKATSDATMADNYQSKAGLSHNGQQIWVEVHGNADTLKGKISKVLSQAQKQVQIQCNDGNTVILPS